MEIQCACNYACVLVCQGLKVEICNQQLTVDFVSQSQSSAGVEANHADFAEQFGDMNHQYQAVASDVSERLKQLDSLQLQWTDYESKVDSLHCWFTEQDAKLGGFMQLQGHAAVQQAIQECNVGIFT